MTYKGLSIFPFWESLDPLCCHEVECLSNGIYYDGQHLFCEYHFNKLDRSNEVTDTPESSPAPPPTLNELDALRLDNALLRVENLQAQIRAIQTETEHHAQRLHVPGYQLTRTANGWIYNPLTGETNGTTA